jgi:membrane protein required for colicin V production
VLDIVLGAILLLSVVGAARNGFTKEALRIASLVVGILAAMWGHGVLALQLRPWIQEGRVAAGVAFVLIFLACVLLGALLAYSLASVWKWTGLRWADMLLGVGFGIVRGLLVSAVVLLALLVFQPFAGTSSIVATSKIAPWVINVARTAAAVAPEAVREAFGRGVSAAEEERAGGNT